MGKFFGLCALSVVLLSTAPFNVHGAGRPVPFVPQSEQVFTYKAIAEIPIVGDTQLATAKWRVKGLQNGVQSVFTLERGDGLLASLIAPRYSIRSKSYFSPQGTRLAIYVYESLGGGATSFSFRNPAQGGISGTCVAHQKPVPCELPKAMDSVGLFARLGQLMHQEPLPSRIPAAVFYRDEKQHIVLQRTKEALLGGVRTVRYEVRGMANLFNLEGVRLFISVRRELPHELEGILITGLAADLRIERTY